MGVSGFPIKAEGSNSAAAQEEPWLSNARGTYNTISNISSKAQFHINSFATGNIDDIIVGQSFFVNSASYPNSYGVITAVNYNNNRVTTDIDFNGSESGDWVYGNNCLFNVDTPEDILREVHVQFDTGSAVIVELTFDGINFMPINNNQTIFGLQTFTIFVTKETKLNFHTPTAFPVEFSITVTSA